MKFKLNIALAAFLLPLGSQSMAADAPLTGLFKTIKDVTISEVAGNEMVINGLQMTSGDSCTLETPTVGANWAGDTLMLSSTAGAATPEAGATPYGETSGVGCSTGISVPGVYEIDGASGASVDITLANASAGGISFVPAGCASDYDDAADGDLCAVLAVGTTNIDLATSNDEVVSAGNGQPEAGKSRIALGGTVTSTIGLSAATAYVVPFDIVVTY